MPKKQVTRNRPKKLDARPERKQNPNRNHSERKPPQSRFRLPDIAPDCNPELW